MADWQPILEGEQRLRVLAEIAEIAEALTSALDAKGMTDRTLARGSAGLSLLFTYLSEAQPGRGHADIGERYLSLAIENLEVNPDELGLYSGYSGIGWTYGHLQGRLLEGGEDEDTHAEIDELIVDRLEHYPRSGDYDLVDGLVGLAVYGFAGRHRPFGRRCLELVVARLEEQSERQGPYLTWRTPPRSEDSRRELVRGACDLGVAHGIAGVAWALAAACEAGIAGAGALLEASVPWLLHNGRDRETGNFGYSWRPDRPITPARTAWCYGDPGVACVLLGAARAAKVPAWEHDALAGGRRAAERAFEACGVTDASLCHGAAGLAHMFNRLYQTTAESKFADAARRWIDVTLSMKRPGTGVAGYRHGNDHIGWRASPGILEGAAGIALALLAAVSPVEPKWDQMLLLGDL